MNDKTVIYRDDIGPNGRFASRGAAIRTLKVGEFIDFSLEGGLIAASIRGSAYQTLGYGGAARCETIGKFVRVWRMR